MIIVVIVMIKTGTCVYRKQVPLLTDVTILESFVQLNGGDFLFENIIQFYTTLIDPS